MGKDRLSGAQQRVMDYLLHEPGNFLIWREYARDWVVLNSEGKTVMKRPARSKTVQILKNRGLLLETDRGIYVAAVSPFPIRVDVERQYND